MRKHPRSLLFSTVAILAACHACDQPPQTDEAPDAAQAIRLVTARPEDGANYPTLPSLPSKLEAEVIAELGSPPVLYAYLRLDPSRNDRRSREALQVLEEQRAVSTLLSCLTHQKDDIQIGALRALRRLGDPRAVSFLVIYAEYIAVFEGGSENATLHGIIQTETASTLSALTGLEVEFRGQRPDELERGIRLWKGWLAEQVPPDRLAPSPRWALPPPLD